jgi:hypothetical protein
VSDLSNLKEDTNIVIDDFHVFTAETLWFCASSCINFPAFNAKHDFVGVRRTASALMAHLPPADQPNHEHSLLSNIGSKSSTLISPTTHQVSKLSHTPLVRTSLYPSSQDRSTYHLIIDSPNKIIIPKLRLERTLSNSELSSDFTENHCGSHNTSVLAALEMTLGYGAN